MKIEISSVIDAPADKVWETVRSFENPERFVPIVTSSSITRTGDSAQRTCTVQLGNQEGRIVEQLERVDDENKILEFSVAEAPPPFAGLHNRFEITSLSDGKTKVNISTNLANSTPEVAKTIEGIFQMSAEGLKKLHEEEVNA
jgi:ribosome-associated toxin RatA of RatAB toxin-antitoxin module